LDQEFNSLHAQRDAAEAFIRSQVGEGWRAVPEHFDDGGYTGANMERPALKRLLAAVEASKVDCVLCYKVDRVSRSIRDFAKIMEILEKNNTTFVSVTQQFNTTTSLGRLTLNILLHFRAHEGQTDRGPEKGKVDWRPPGAWLRSGPDEAQAGSESGRGRACPEDLRLVLARRFGNRVGQKVRGLGMADETVDHQ
jgi:site-specific DNA recombinase